MTSRIRVGEKGILIWDPPVDWIPWDTQINANRDRNNQWRNDQGTSRSTKCRPTTVALNETRSSVSHSPTKGPLINARTSVLQYCYFSHCFLEILVIFSEYFEYNTTTHDDPRLPIVCSKTTLLETLKNFKVRNNPKQINRFNCFNCLNLKQ